jgi:hypothetical protein
MHSPKVSRDGDQWLVVQSESMQLRMKAVAGGFSQEHLLGKQRFPP